MTFIIAYLIIGLLLLALVSWHYDILAIVDKTNIWSILEMIISIVIYIAIWPVCVIVGVILVRKDSTK